MRRVPENPRVVEQLCGERSWDSISPADWREVFDDFQKFSYRSTKDRLLDFETVVGAGLWILYEHDARECLRLAEWALSDAQYISESKELPHAYFLKSLALIKLGEKEAALDFYLAQIRAMPKGSMRRLAYIFGVHLFIELKPFERDGERDGRDFQVAAPEEIVRFARGLVLAHYPDRKLPLVLREEAESEAVSWGQMHKALVRYSSARR